MSDSSFCSFAFNLRLYYFLDFFSFLCSYEPLSPTFFFSPFLCSGSMMHMESLILLGGLPFDVCLVLSGSHISVCFQLFSQTAEPSSTVIIFLILNGFSLLLSIPLWSLFSIFLHPVSQCSKLSSTAIIFLFPLGLTTFFLCSSCLFFLHSIGKSTFLSTY